MYGKELTVPANSWSSKESTVRLSADQDKQILIAIDKAVVLSKPSKLSRHWWTWEITQQQAELAHLKRTNLRNSVVVKTASKKWTGAMQKAQSE